MELGECRQSVSTAASPPPPQSSHLIQQPLFPEVRGLDPLTWALWRGVNQQQLKSLQEDFRVLGLWKERREGLYMRVRAGVGTVWYEWKAWAWTQPMLRFQSRRMLEISHSPLVKCFLHGRWFWQNSCWFGHINSKMKSVIQTQRDGSACWKVRNTCQLLNQLTDSETKLVTPTQPQNSVKSSSLKNCFQSLLDAQTFSCVTINNIVVLRRLAGLVIFRPPVAQHGYSFEGTKETVLWW